MIELFFDKNMITDVVTDLRFLEMELSHWYTGLERDAQKKAEAYYAGRHDILKEERKMVDKSGELVEVKYLPNNRIVDNQYARMVDQIANFEMGQPITFDTDFGTPTGKQFGEALGEVFDKSMQRIIRQVGVHAINEGIAWMYVWLSEDGKFKISRFPASEILPFWSDAEHTDLDCAIRLYDVIEYDENAKRKHVWHVEVYDATGIHRFIWKDDHLIADRNKPAVPYLNVKFSNEEVVPYNWLRMPLIPIKGNDAEMPLLMKCKSLQDALNKVLSTFQNGMEENANKSTLIVKNYDGSNWGELLQNLRTIGIIPVRTTDGAEGGVEVLKIELDVSNYKAAIEQFKKAIVENCGGFDAKDDRMSGNPNQMNIQSMYADIEITGNSFETENAPAFDQLLWFVKQHLKQTGKGDFENEKADAIFNRDMMVNESEVIKNCNESRDIISRETILKNHSWVDDPAEELKRIEKEEEEAQARADLFSNGFGDHDHDNGNEVIDDGEA